jgi:hypothetical protein
MKTLERIFGLSLPGFWSLRAFKRLSGDFGGPVSARRFARLDQLHWSADLLGAIGRGENLVVILLAAHKSFRRSETISKPNWEGYKDFLVHYSILGRDAQATSPAEPYSS